MRGWAGSSLATAALVFALAAAGASCGGNDREAAFREATESLAEAERAAEEARTWVAEEARAAEAAQAELARAEAGLAAAEETLAEARAQVGLHATDDVLFREIQTRLLDDDLLSEVAIAARVEKGTVTLSGQVADTDQRDRAAEIAGAVPGIIAVDNRVSVAEATEKEN